MSAVDGYGAWVSVRREHVHILADAERVYLRDSDPANDAYGARFAAAPPLELSEREVPLDRGLALWSIVDYGENWVSLQSYGRYAVPILYSFGRRGGAMYGLLRTPGGGREAFIQVLVDERVYAADVRESELEDVLTYPDPARACDAALAWTAYTVLDKLPAEAPFPSFELLHAVTPRVVSEPLQAAARLRDVDASDPLALALALLGVHHAGIERGFPRAERMEAVIHAIRYLAENMCHPIYGQWMAALASVAYVRGEVSP